MNGLVVKQAELVIMDIGQQYCYIMSVQLLLSNSSHVLAALRYALTIDTMALSNVLFTEL